MAAVILLMGGLQLAALVARIIRKVWQAAPLLAASTLIPFLTYVARLVQRLPAHYA